MKKLLLYLVTANFSGTLISMVIFLVNTYRLDIHEYFLYSFLNSALIIGGLFILYGTDNLALSLYDELPVTTIYGNVKRIKFKMQFLGLLIFLGACVYFINTKANYSILQIIICFFVSLPFLFSFYFTDTHLYIHKEVYNKFVKTTIVTKLLCLAPILIAAYFKKHLLIITLSANSISVILPALMLNKQLVVSNYKRVGAPRIFSSGRLFENFILNSYPVLYINASFFLYNLEGSSFSENKIIIYSSRIYIILASIVSSIISVIISSHLKKVTLYFEKFKKALIFTGVLLLLLAPLIKFFLELDESFNFIIWLILELIALTFFLILFFINIYSNKVEGWFVPGLFLLTTFFFMFTKFCANNLEVVMFYRTLYLVVLIFINILLINKKQVKNNYEKAFAN